MDQSELKQIIGEVTIVHFERSSQEGDFPDWMSQEDQQKLFDDFVRAGYQGFTENPKLMAQLQEATKEDLRDYFTEKFHKWKELLGGMSVEELQVLIAKATRLM